MKQAVLAAFSVDTHTDRAAAYGNELEVGEVLALQVGPGNMRNSRDKSHSCDCIDAVLPASL